VQGGFSQPPVESTSIKGKIMAAVLGTNVASLWASKNLQSAQSNMADSVERLSSGLRINRARDDAAGLGLANALTQQINSSQQGIRNINDGISMVQTAEGALAQASEMAQRILSLAVQATNGSLNSTQKTSINSEMAQLITGINNIETRTKFSGTTLLGASAAISIYNGKDSTDKIDITTAALAKISNGTSGGTFTLSGWITTAAGASSGSASDYQAVATSAAAFITSLDTQRGLLGAIQNQMEYSVNNVTELAANLTSARSRVIDTDYASETANLTKGQILQQAATAMLAQANQMPNVILSLLK
jgi:flagellin